MMPSSGARSVVVLNGKLSGSQRQRSFSRGTSEKDDVSCMWTPLAWPGRTYDAPAYDIPMVTCFLPHVNLCPPVTHQQWISGRSVMIYPQKYIPVKIITSMYQVLTYYNNSIYHLTSPV